jgi:hypothetical protein
MAWQFSAKTPSAVAQITSLIAILIVFSLVWFAGFVPQRQAARGSAKVPGRLLVHFFPVLHLPVGLVAADAIGFLNLAHKLITSTADLGKRIVGQPAPLLFHFSRHLFPVAFYAIPIHLYPFGDAVAANTQLHLYAGCQQPSCQAGLCRKNKGLKQAIGLTQREQGKNCWACCKCCLHERDDVAPRSKQTNDCSRTAAYAPSLCCSHTARVLTQGPRISP